MSYIASHKTDLEFFLKLTKFSFGSSTYVSFIPSDPHLQCRDPIQGEREIFGSTLETTLVLRVSMGAILRKVSLLQPERDSNPETITYT